jgi:carbonic anhydrase
MAAIGSEKDDYKACCLNVDNSVKKIQENIHIPGLKAMGAVYHIDDGHVEFKEQ